MPCEIQVTIKDEEKRLRSNFLIHEVIAADLLDPTVQSCINKTLESFKSDEYDVKVKIILL